MDLVLPALPVGLGANSSGGLNQEQECPCPKLTGMQYANVYESTLEPLLWFPSSECNAPSTEEVPPWGPGGTEGEQELWKKGRGREGPMPTITLTVLLGLPQP